MLPDKFQGKLQGFVAFACTVEAGSLQPLSQIHSPFFRSWPDKNGASLLLLTSGYFQNGGTHFQSFSVIQDGVGGAQSTNG